MSVIQRREVTRFRNHVRKLSEKDHLGMDGFDAELTELRQVDQRVRSNLDEFYTGSLGSSLPKNRFDDVKPNEGTIVRLQPISKNGEGTYINANYIDARETLDVPFVYIATQAPLQNTILDFWRMIYENDVAFIVMLCNTQENGKSKSKMYWPALGEVSDFKLLTIANVDEKSYLDSVHRTLILRTIRGDERTITHMQHLGWPDEGVPEASAPLMMMIQTIAKSPRSITSPITVHCSGGVGRTGVFISLHILLAQLQQEHTHLNVPRVVHFLKLCRSGMVQRKDQYIFLYYATLREMERMILSCDTEEDLLQNVSPVIRDNHHTAHALRPNGPAGPPVMAMPTKTRKKRFSLARLFKSNSPSGGERPDTAESSLVSSESRKSKTKSKDRDTSNRSSLILSPSTPANMTTPPSMHIPGIELPQAIHNTPQHGLTERSSVNSRIHYDPITDSVPVSQTAASNGGSLEEELERVKRANRLKRLNF